MHIYYDNEADYLEIRFGRPSPAYYEDMGDGIFERHDEKTDKLTGYAIYNVKRRAQHQVTNVEIDVPVPA